MLADLPASQRIPDEELRNVTGCQGGMAIGEGKGGEGGARSFDSVTVTTVDPRIWRARSGGVRRGEDGEQNMTEAREEKEAQERA